MHLHCWCSRCVEYLLPDLLLQPPDTRCYCMPSSNTMHWICACPGSCVGLYDPLGISNVVCRRVTPWSMRVLPYMSMQTIPLLPTAVCSRALPRPYLSVSGQLPRPSLQALRQLRTEWAWMLAVGAAAAASAVLGRSREWCTLRIRAPRSYRNVPKLAGNKAQTQGVRLASCGASRNMTPDPAS
jgi:hypothetical protein